MELFTIFGIVTVSYIVGELFYYYLTDEFYIVSAYRWLIGR